MIQNINLRGGNKMVHHFGLPRTADRKLSVTLNGFIATVSLTMDESAIARMSGDSFDIAVESTIYREISSMSSDSIIRMDISTMKAQKKVSADSEVAIASEISVGAQKRIETDIGSIMNTNFGEIYLYRPRTMADDLESMMTDDFDLFLTETSKFDEMG